MFIPNNVMSDHEPCAKEHAVLSTKRGRSIVRHAALRDILQRSCINAIETSAIDIVDVIAATVRNKKNNADHT